MHHKRYRILSAASCLLWIMPLICLSGCVRFESEFATAKRQPIRPADPIVGVWQGSWQSDLSPGTYSARCVVIRKTSSTCDIALELSQFHGIAGTWAEASDTTVEKIPDDTQRFVAKVPIASCYKRNVWAEAIALTGTAGHDTFTIVYSTNDAIRELDHGHVDLHRAPQN